MMEAHSSVKHAGHATDCCFIPSPTLVEMDALCFGITLFKLHKQHIPLSRTPGNEITPYFNMLVGDGWMDCRASGTIRSDVAFCPY